MKVVINICHGGYGLSDQAVQYLADLGVKEAIEALTPPEIDGKIFKTQKDVDDHVRWGRNSHSLYARDRANPNLIKVVKALRAKANGEGSELSIEDIGDSENWTITEHAGAEELTTSERYI